MAANLEAIVQRTYGHSSTTVNVGNLIVDLSRNCTAIGSTQLDLKAKEFRIIKFLALCKRAVLSKDAFLTHLCGSIDEPEPKIIDVFLCK